jgi:hypothetical protein
MNRLAQCGTSAAALVVCAWFFGACAKTSHNTEASPDAGRLDSSVSDDERGGREDVADAGTHEPSSTAPECTKHSDCEIVSDYCCACPPWMPGMVKAKAVQRTTADKHMCAGVSCAACAIEDPAPLLPVYTAACIRRRCALTDLRETSDAQCSRDSDCKAVGLGCCGARSDHPVEYVGLRTDAYPQILACDPAPHCPASVHGEPVAFCAADARCAVRRRQASDDPEPNCWSPDRNVISAIDGRLGFGCVCDKATPPVCVQAAGTGVLMSCGENRRWEALESGCDPNG